MFPVATMCNLQRYTTRQTQRFKPQANLLHQSDWINMLCKQIPSAETRRAAFSSDVACRAHGIGDNEFRCCTESGFWIIASRCPHRIQSTAQDKERHRRVPSSCA